jgi:cobalt-zinc-cadmium resistance protein CzcA
MELKSLNDWVVVNQLKSVPNIVDVNPFGGPTREYQVQLDPGKLVSYGLSLSQIESALVANNINAGGGFIERGEQAVNVRAVGLMQTTDDIAATLYVFWARPGDKLPPSEQSFMAEGEHVD